MPSDSNIEEVFNVKSINEVNHYDEAEAVSRKVMFFNLKNVLNLENNILQKQESSQFLYIDSKGLFAMNWHTAKQYQSGRAPKTF